MNLDKMAYLALGCFTSLLIILVIVFGTYGSNISKDPTFISFFKWYIFLFVFNLFNILVTLIFHYIMAEIPGVQGLKGYTGDKGLPGESGKCFCDTDKDGTPENIKSLDITDDIHTRDFIETFASGDRIGTMIYHGKTDTSLTADYRQKVATAAAAAEKYKEIIKYFMEATMQVLNPSATIIQALQGVEKGGKLEELWEYLVNTGSNCVLSDELSATNCSELKLLLLLMGPIPSM